MPRCLAQPCARRWDAPGRCCSSSEHSVVECMQMGEGYHRRVCVVDRRQETRQASRDSRTCSHSVPPLLDFIWCETAFVFCCRRGRRYPSACVCGPRASAPPTSPPPCPLPRRLRVRASTIIRSFRPPASRLPAGAPLVSTLENLCHESTVNAPETLYVPSQGGWRWTSSSRCWCTLPLRRAPTGSTAPRTRPPAPASPARCAYSRGFLPGYW